MFSFLFRKIWNLMCMFQILSSMLVEVKRQNNNVLTPMTTPLGAHDMLPQAITWPNPGHDGKADQIDQYMGSYLRFSCVTSIETHAYTFLVNEELIPITIPKI